jgi:uncharacterized membrane protein YfhO
LPDAHLSWLNRHEALIDADVRPGDVIFTQISYNLGWHAEQGGATLPVARDALGMMYIKPATYGHSHLRLVYDGGNEAIIARILQAVGFLIVASIALSGTSNPNR